MIPSAAQDSKARRQLLIDSVTDVYNQVVPTTPVDMALFAGGGGGRTRGIATGTPALSRSHGGNLGTVGIIQRGLTEERLAALKCLLASSSAPGQLRDCPHQEDAGPGAPSSLRRLRIKRKTRSTIPSCSCNTLDDLASHLHGLEPCADGAGLPALRRLCIRSILLLMHVMAIALSTAEMLPPLLVMLLAGCPLSAGAG